MAIPWGTLKSLLIFFGPILLPKALSYYRSVRAAPRIQGLKVRPLPRRIRLAISLLLLTAGFFLLLTLPPFSPEHIFRLTQSRLQIPADVLFTRLASLRPHNTLTPTDLALRAKFASLESRLVYLHLGPSTVATCPFCTSDDPRSYLYYFLPELLAPHLANLAVVTAATSALLTRDDPRGVAGWRAPAALAAAALALADLYLVAAHDHAANARALRLAEIDSFYWTARAARYAALAALDAGLAALCYLTGTQRAFVRPPAPAERLEAVVRGLGGVKGKINAAGVVKNTVLRDEELRGRCNAYWAHEVRLMREMMEDREVVEGVNDALLNRIDIAGIERDAEAYAKAVLMPSGEGRAATEEVVG
ncbi:4dcafbaa-7f9b-4491-83b2-9419c4183c9e [Thermothielavioides terrestris]|uniref:Uncharacterized protein n=2 Tax=Thermothielavioides terrestris TaxID=2587410 RepID=G2RFQ6_THETT|nr:uncharacterized protein THITE_2058437 [Thermothielavioides terrestris NRRL 8126]AEO71660.1 hypothetical protein THITE_2058437 [Thermothielavioides terrestris NRRL 8126]SPQ27354.1 4dcafbaa-7f9b-4491-83b2-9419c4183c9e [Thermothielavioides terrestris]